MLTDLLGELPSKRQGGGRGLVSNNASMFNLVYLCIPILHSSIMYVHMM